MLSTMTQLVYMWCFVIEVKVKVQRLIFGCSCRWGLRDVITWQDLMIWVGETSCHFLCWSFLHMTLTQIGTHLQSQCFWCSSHYNLQFFTMTMLFLERERERERWFQDIAISKRDHTAIHATFLSSIFNEKSMKLESTYMDCWRNMSCHHSKKGDQGLASMSKWINRSTRLL